MTSKIFLENVKIYGAHGVLPEEKVIGTYFILNAEVHADLQRAAETDDLEDTVNYAQILEVLQHEMKKPSRLLEHVLGRMTEELQTAFPRLTYIKLKLTKTNPPMAAEMDGVSIEMEKIIPAAEDDANAGEPYNIH